MKFIMTTALLLSLTFSVKSNALLPTQLIPCNVQIDDELQEKGILRLVEDSGYPFVVLSVEFPERKFTESFTLNLEEVKGIKMETLNKWIGKYVAFSYTSELVNDLLDLKLEEKSILGDEKIESGPDSKTITGVLKGAKQATAGDVPDMISVNGISFEFFITPEMVKANGQTVTAVYEEATENTITKIKLVK